MAAAPTRDTKRLIEEFKKTTEKIGGESFSVEFLKDKALRAESATQGSTAIIEDESKKAAAQNLLDNSTDLLGKEKAPTKVIQKARANLNNPTKVAQVAQKEQQGRRQSSLADAFTAAAVHFTPIILGGLIGGDEGVAIGAQAGQASANLIRSQEAAAADAEVVQQKISLQKRALDISETQFEKTLGEKRRKTNIDFKLRAKKLGLAMQKARGTATLKSRITKLSAEGKKRVEGIAMGLEAIHDIRKLMEKENTFELIGDSDFTFATGRWTEAIGRLQSGGAITEDEGVSFRGLVPQFKDNAAVQANKVKTMIKEMERRLAINGFEPLEFGFEKMNKNIFDLERERELLKRKEATTGK